MHRTPAELHTFAISVLERIELLDDSLSLGTDPGDRAIVSVMASAVELHRELARTMGETSLLVDEGTLGELCGTLARINDMLVVVEGALGRTVAA